MKNQAMKKAQKDKKPSKKASGKTTPGKWDEMNRKQRREMMRQMQSEDLSLEVVHPQAAGIDIGNESHYVAVPPSRDPQIFLEFRGGEFSAGEMGDFQSALTGD
jgi:transposase